MKLYDIEAAVGYLRSIGASSASKNCVRTLICSGQIPHIRLGKKFYVTQSSLDSWLERHERRAK
jgi:excisionase family DNA binding protein